MQFLLTKSESPLFIVLLFIVSGCFVYLFWIFKMSSSHSNSNVKYSLEIKVYWSLKGCTCIIMLHHYISWKIVSKWLLLFIAIISGTIYHPGKFVIVTGLPENWKVKNEIIGWSNLHELRPPRCGSGHQWAPGQSVAVLSLFRCTNT